MTALALPYEPHSLCLLHDPWIIAMHVVSDLMIAAAYFGIPACLLYCARRQDLLFRGVLIWFGVFIVGCGWTHIGNALEVWYPLYWVTGLVKLGTGVVSWVTLAKLRPIIPQVLNLPSLAELEQIRQWMLRPQAERVQKLVAESVMEAMLDDLNKITQVLKAFQRPR